MELGSSDQMWVKFWQNLALRAKISARPFGGNMYPYGYNAVSGLTPGAYLTSNLWEPHPRILRTETHDIPALAKILLLYHSQHRIISTTSLSGFLERKYFRNLPFLTIILGAFQPQASCTIYKLELVKCTSTPSSFGSRSDTLQGHPASFAAFVDILIPESMSFTDIRERVILGSNPSSVVSMAVPEDAVTDLAGRIIWSSIWGRYITWSVSLDIEGCISKRQRVFFGNATNFFCFQGPRWWPGWTRNFAHICFLFIEACW
jgi:hypothetical protein